MLFIDMTFLNDMHIMLILLKEFLIWKRGVEFYEKLLGRNNFPYVKQQYALFLQRKTRLDLAWE